MVALIARAQPQVGAVDRHGGGGGHKASGGTQLRPVHLRHRAVSETHSYDETMAAKLIQHERNQSVTIPRSPAQRAGCRKCPGGSRWH